jgi:hypothetical protein
MFKLKGSVPERLVRDPRGTKWDSFRWDLRGRLEQGPRMNIEDEAGLGPNVSYLQQVLISAYENNCPLRIARAGKLTLRWTSNLETLRREVRRLFNKSRRDRTSQNWELHKGAQRRYKKEVRKASKNSWRAFCNSINDLPTSVRLHRALSREPKTKLGSLVTPSGLQTQSEGETIELLLATHFPDSVFIEEMAAPAAACRAKQCDWRVAAEVVTYKKSGMGD